MWSQLATAILLVAGCVAMSDIKVGVLLPMSTSIPWLNPPLLLPALTIALDDVTRAGLLPEHNIVWDYRDSACSPDVATAGLLQLKQNHSDLAAVIGPICGDEACVSTQYILKAWDLPQLATCIGDGLSNTAIFSTFFRMTSPVSFFLPPAAAFLRSQNWTRMSFIGDTDATSQTSINLAAISFRGLGVTSSLFFLDPIYNPQQWKEELLKVRESTNRIVTVYGSGPSFVRLVLLVAQELGMTGPNSTGWVWISAFSNENDWFTNNTDGRDAEAFTAFNGVLSLRPEPASGPVFAAFKPRLDHLRCATYGLCEALPDGLQSEADYNAGLLYDTVLNYALAINKTLSMGLTPFDTPAVMSNLIQSVFMGTTGVVLHNVNGDRYQPYEAYYIWDSRKVRIASYTFITGQLTYLDRIRFADGGYDVPPDTVPAVCKPGFFAQPGDDETCVPCPVGSYTATGGMTACTLCAARTVQPSLGQSACIQCPPGTSAPEIGMARCLNCEPGTYWESETGRCTPCRPGSFSALPRQTSCTPCPLGTAQGGHGMVTCQSCGLRAYQDTPGQTACLECPSKTSTCTFPLNASKFECLPAAEQETDCVCIAGTFGPPGGPCFPCLEGAYCCACPNPLRCADPSPDLPCDLEGLLHLMETLDQPCHECVVGPPTPTTRRGGYNATYLLDHEGHNHSTHGGHRRETVASMPSYYERQLLIPCVPPFACAGGPLNSCTKGFTGTRCSECQAGYYRNNVKECVPCESNGISEGLLTAAVVVPLVVGAVFLYNAAQMFRASAVTILLDWAQTLSVISAFNIRYPDYQLGIFRLFNALDFDISIVPAACMMPRSRWQYVHIWSLQLALPLLLLVACSVVFGAVSLAQKATSLGLAMYTDSATMVNTVCICLTVVYTIVTKRALEIFSCISPKEGAPISFVSAQPGLRCGSQEWMPFLAVSCAVVGVYSVGVPLASFLLLRHHRTKLATPEMRRKFGSLYAIYRDEVYYWNSWFLTRRALIILCLVAFPDETLLQLCLALLLVVGSMLLDLRLKPFVYGPSNRVRLLCNIHVVFTLVAAIVYYFDMQGQSRVTDGQLLGIAVVKVICCIVAGIACIRGFINEHLSYRVKPNARLDKIFNSRLGKCIFAGVYTRHWASAQENRQRFQRDWTKQERESAFPRNKSSALEVTPTSHYISVHVSRPPFQSVKVWRANHIPSADVRGGKC